MTALSDTDTEGLSEEISDALGKEDEDKVCFSVGVYDSAAEEEREIRADPEKEEETVFVFELLKLWDGLADTLGVFVCMLVLLGDDETLEDFVMVPLAVSDTDTVDVLELV
jgi:hypothetical protein